MLSKNKKLDAKGAQHGRALVNGLSGLASTHDADDDDDGVHDAEHMREMQGREQLSSMACLQCSARFLPREPPPLFLRYVAVGGCVENGRLQTHAPGSHTGFSDAVAHVAHVHVWPTCSCSLCGVLALVTLMLVDGHRRGVKGGIQGLQGVCG